MSQINNINLAMTMEDLIRGTLDTALQDGMGWAQ